MVSFISGYTNVPTVFNISTILRRTEFIKTDMVYADLRVRDDTELIVVLSNSYPVPPRDNAYQNGIPILPFPSIDSGYDPLIHHWMIIQREYETKPKLYIGVCSYMAITLDNFRATLRPAKVDMQKILTDIDSKSNPNAKDLYTFSVFTDTNCPSIAGSSIYRSLNSYYANFMIEDTPANHSLILTTILYVLDDLRNSGHGRKKENPPDTDPPKSDYKPDKEEADSELTLHLNIP